jgi:predicted alpha/beta-hydrolase family hydrolase
MEREFDQDGVQGVLHEPDGESTLAIALTHGAGTNCNSPLLVRLAEAFADNGCLVLRYDLTFRREGRKGAPVPAVAVRDRAGIAATLQALRRTTRSPVVAAGHSYGGRQTSMIAAERRGLADALLLLSYPLHPPKRPEQMRTAHFPELRTPALFVHGTKDGFGSVEEVRDAAALIPARTDLLAVEGAGHDLKRAPDLATEILTRLRALL